MFHEGPDVHTQQANKNRAPTKVVGFRGVKACASASVCVYTIILCHACPLLHRSYTFECQTTGCVCVGLATYSSTKASQ